MSANTKITNIRPAGFNERGQEHQVITVTSSGETRKHGYRRKPCKSCPWRVDAVGEFPAEAFRHSAETAYDMSQNAFGCHESGKDKPATCAGFLLRGADHNLGVRMNRIMGQSFDDVTDGGHELHKNYRAMAVANGVAPTDPVLTACRD